MPDQEDDEQVPQPEDENLLQQALAGAAQFDTGAAANPAMSPSAATPAPVPSAPSVGAQPLGRRMAPPVPVAQSPATDSNAPPDVKIPFDASKMPPGLLALAPTTPNSIPAPPTGSNNPKLADLAREQAMYGKPLDPSAVDPATGKPTYKMGTKGKILGSLVNFASGFGRNPGNPIYVGPGATNARYSRDESMREGNLANVNTQIGTQKTLDTENEKQYEDATRQAYEGQLGEARTKTAEAAESRAATAGELADTKSQLVKSQQDLNEARANRANQDKTPTSEFSGWYSSFKQENKRNPTAKEIQQYELDKARAGKDTTAADTQRAIQVSEYKRRQLEAIDRQKEAERTKRYAEIDKDVTTKYDPEKLGAAKKQVDDALESKYAPKVQQMSDEADKMLGLTKAGAKLQASSSPSKPNTTPNAAPKAPPKAGDTIMVAGKPRKVLGFNATTKKPIVAPAGQ
jgi:hypothetical protein